MLGKIVGGLLGGGNPIGNMAQQAIGHGLDAATKGVGKGQQIGQAGQTKGAEGKRQKGKEEDLLKRLVKMLLQLLQKQGAPQAAGGQGAEKAGGTGQNINAALKKLLLDKLQEKGVQVSPKIEKLVEQAVQSVTGGAAAAGPVGATGAATIGG